MAEQPTSSRSLRQGAVRAAGLLAALLAALFLGSYLLDEPLRRVMERRINAPLVGYSVRLARVHLQLVGGSLTLNGLTVLQRANPDPPIARFPVIRFGIRWREIALGKVVAEVALERPEVRVDLRQYRTEAANPVPLKKQGWQQAVESIYPFKINNLEIDNGSLTYIDQDPNSPLRLTRLDLRAANIRNVRSPRNVYPSSFRMETAIFGTGRGVVDGNANFLAEPHLGIKARLALENVPLEYFRPVVARGNLSIDNGTFSGSGEIEYAPNVKVAHFKDLAVRGMAIDYVHSARAAEAAKKGAEAIAKAVKEAPEAELILRVDRLRFERCTVGMKNENSRPPYRVYLADATLDLRNFSSRFSQGPAEAVLTGKFMGSGPTVVDARFRPEKEGPDLDLDVRIEDTRMADMNDLFRAYGKFDVTDGRFAFYSQLSIRGEAISGYIKPFFKDMKVYDERTDRDKKIFRQMYEALVGGVARLLESRHRHEVAVKADISGSVSRPRVSSWQIIGRLVENAFFKTILPGFEEEAARAPKGGRGR